MVPRSRSMLSRDSGCRTAESARRRRPVTEPGPRRGRRSWTARADPSRPEARAGRACELRPAAVAAQQVPVVRVRGRAELRTHRARHEHPRSRTSGVVRPGPGQVGGRVSGGVACALARLGWCRHGLLQQPIQAGLVGGHEQVVAGPAGAPGLRRRTRAIWRRCRRDAGPEDARRAGAGAFTLMVPIRSRWPAPRECAVRTLHFPVPLPHRAGRRRPGPFGRVRGQSARVPGADRCARTTRQPTQCAPCSRSRPGWSTPRSRTRIRRGR